MLADGTVMPLLGLGVWQVPDGPECVHAVRWALELGYRHIDTAQAYGNEASVGQGAARERRRRATRCSSRRSSIPAAGPARRGRPQHRAARGRLRRPVHRPLAAGRRRPGPGREWRPRARAATPGRSASPTSTSTSSIRSSRRRPSPPVVNQVQFNPSAYRKALLDACGERDRARGLQPARAPAPPRGRHRRRRIAETPRANPGPGAAPLVRPARASRSSPSRPIASASRRTRRSSTSRCPTRTWRSSTRSTAPEAPERALERKWW